jgi:hypothetical protein
LCVSIGVERVGADELADGNLAIRQPFCDQGRDLVFSAAEPDRGAVNRACGDCNRYSTPKTGTATGYLKGSFARCWGRRGPPSVLASTGHKVGHMPDRRPNSWKFDRACAASRVDPSCSSSRSLRSSRWQSPRH